MNKFVRWTILVAGIVAGQAILYGPSLIGRKILLPVDLLALPNFYLPQTPQTQSIVPHNFVLSDQIIVEVSRRFAVDEIRAGRAPLWGPFHLGGTPLNLPKFSPLRLLDYGIQSPVVLAWTQMLHALVAGIGAFLFFRRILRVGFWPAALVAWCYPLTGSFVFWQGYGLTSVLVWLPWILMAVDTCARRPTRGGLVALVLATCLVIVSGPLDVAAQVLLTSGFYAIWCFLDEYGRQLFARRALRAGVVTVAGWGLGFLLAAPYLLPVLQYAQTGSRMARRTQGEEERPPVGLAALPQTVLPDLYGSTQAGSLPMFPKGQGNQLESSAQTYTGLLATLLVAPLAWCSRRHRSINVFWAILGFFALSWSLDVPGLVSLLRMPVFNMMSHNRFVFATTFALLAMTAEGLDLLWHADLVRRHWFWIPTALLVVIGVVCLFRTYILPEPLATQLENMVREGKAGAFVRDSAGVRQVQATFSRMYAFAALLCGLGISGWLLLWFGVKPRPWHVALLGGLLLGDLLWFGYGRSAQCDPALYYPRIPVLEQVAKATPGRVIGYRCLPAVLSQTHGLHDIRGYDGVDPARMIDLLMITADPTLTPLIPYALTQQLVPRVAIDPSGKIRLHPLLDMLDVRYVIFRGAPPPAAGLHPDFVGDDYWVLSNPRALPRVFVPQRVEVVEDDRARLAKLADTNFDPRQVAYVESPVTLSAPCQGTAEIANEIPTQITVAAKMETAGLLVLADLWDPGWRAYVDGRPEPILRANHAVRGVMLPAGAAQVVFRYEPRSLFWGLGLAAAALVVSLVWLATGYGLRGVEPLNDAVPAPVPSAPPVAPSAADAGRRHKRRRKR